MLIEHKLANSNYICNFCRVEYTDEDALLYKGNHFFCSKTCVLAYDKKTTEEDKL